MENKDRIEGLFQRNAYKLERKPSNRAWSRLESRLDRDAHRPRFRIVRGFGLVAASLALALMAYTVVFVGQSHSNKSSKWAMNNLGVVPTEIEILSSEADSDYSNNMYAIVEYSRSYSPKAINFNEGKAGQRILTREELNGSTLQPILEKGEEGVQSDSTSNNSNG